MDQPTGKCPVTVKLGFVRTSVIVTSTTCSHRPERCNLQKRRPNSSWMTCCAIILLICSSVDCSVRKFSPTAPVVRCCVAQFSLNLVSMKCFAVQFSLTSCSMNCSMTRPIHKNCKHITRTESKRASKQSDAKPKPTPKPRKQCPDKQRSASDKQHPFHELLG